MSVKKQTATSKKTEKTPKTTEKKKTTTTKKKADKPKDSGVTSTITAGDTNCYLYVSVNLTRDSRLGEVISLGMVTQSGENAYIEITDYNDKFVTDEVRSDVVANLLNNNNADIKVASYTMADARDHIFSFIYQNYIAKDKVVQVVMDKVSWDWPVFKELLQDTNLKLPQLISPVVIDINTQLADNITVPIDKIKSVSDGEGRYKNFIPSIAIYNDLNIINTANELNGIPEPLKLLHDSNALKKAYAIRSIHRSIWNIN